MNKLYSSLLVLICILFIAIFCSADYQNSVEGDRQALMDLYAATGGDSWSNDSGWGSGNPDNSWYGVEVDGNGRVVRLDLQDNGLEGQLPESIGNLTQVRYLNVKQNRLSGRIPSSIGNMKSLQSLYLNGRISDLSVENPHHPGKSPGGSWADERSNNFTGTLPESIGQLTNLEWFELNGTGHPGEGLEGAIPESIGNLSKLKVLQLDHNRLSSLPSSLGKLTNLVNLALGHQGWEGNTYTLAGHGFPQWISNLENLRYLWFEKNKDIGGELPDMSRLTKLEIVLIDFAGLTGPIPTVFTDGTMPYINMVQMPWNEFTGNMPGIKQPNNLKAYTVNGNNLTGEIPDSWSSDAAADLVNFGFAWNELEGEIPDLSHMHQLRYVRANDNNFTGTPPMVDTSNEDLNFMHFHNNRMSGTVPAELAEVGNLPLMDSGDLNLSNNDFSSGDLDPLIEGLESDGNGNVLNY